MLNKRISIRKGFFSKLSSFMLKMLNFVLGICCIRVENILYPRGKLSINVKLNCKNIWNSKSANLKTNKKTRHFTYNAAILTQKWCQWRYAVQEQVIWDSLSTDINNIHKKLNINIKPKNFIKSFFTITYGQEMMTLPNRGHQNIP